MKGTACGWSQSTARQPTSQPVANHGMNFFHEPVNHGMAKTNHPTRQENYDDRHSPDLYNRPGSTEHNDYRINTENEELSAGKKGDRDGADGTIPTTEEERDRQ